MLCLPEENPLCVGQQHPTCHCQSAGVGWPQQLTVHIVGTQRAGSNGPMLAFSNSQEARNNTFIRAAYLGAKVVTEDMETCAGICSNTPKCQYYAYCPPGGPDNAG